MTPSLTIQQILKKCKKDGCGAEHSCTRCVAKHNNRKKSTPKTERRTSSKRFLEKLTPKTSSSSELKKETVNPLLILVHELQDEDFAESLRSTHQSNFLREAIKAREAKRKAREAMRLKNLYLYEIHKQKTELREARESKRGKKASSSSSRRRS